MRQQILEMLTIAKHLYNELMHSSKLKENLRNQAKHTYEEDLHIRLNILLDVVNAFVKTKKYPDVKNPDEAIKLVSSADNLHDEMVFLSRSRDIIGHSIHSEKPIAGKDKLKEAIEYLDDAKKKMIGYHGIAKMTGQL